MWYKKEENSNGDFADENGIRYDVNECNAAHTPNGLNFGYTFFESQDLMMELWELHEVNQREK